MPTNKKATKARTIRPACGAVYTTFALSAVVPLVSACILLFLEIGYGQYESNRLCFIVNDVYEQLNDNNLEITENSLLPLLLASSKSNGLTLENLKIRRENNSSNDDTQEFLEIKITGIIRRQGLLKPTASINRYFRLQKKTGDRAYIAINSYPLCQADPPRGLSAYLPVARPRSGAATWAFNQDTAISSARKNAVPLNGQSDENENTWWRGEGGELSIY